MCWYSYFVVIGGKTHQDSQKNVSTIWRKLYYAEECVPMSGKVLKWLKSSLMKTAQAVQPLHEQWTLLNKLSELLLLIEPTSWASAVDMHSPSSKLWNSQCNIHGVWKGRG
jgi:desulfoferrodoxin (superoxide reductase-like protein)